MYDSPVKVISPTQKPLHDNTQYLQETESMLPVGFEPAIPGSDRLQNHPLNCAATGSGFFNSGRKTSRKNLCNCCRELWNPHVFNSETILTVTRQEIRKISLLEIKYG